MICSVVTYNVGCVTYGEIPGLMLKAVKNMSPNATSVTNFSNNGARHPYDSRSLQFEAKRFSETSLDSFSLNKEVESTQDRRRLPSPGHLWSESEDVSFLSSSFTTLPFDLLILCRIVTRICPSKAFRYLTSAPRKDKYHTQITRQAQYHLVRTSHLLLQAGVLHPPI